MTAKRCILPDCIGKSRRPNVYCSTHNANNKRYGNPYGPGTPERNDTADEMYCYNCGVYRDEYEFNLSNTLCDPCHKRNRTAKNYGVSLQELDRLYADNLNCNICQSNLATTKNRHIDHDHACCPGQRSCGKCIRGILCQACNMMLGFAKDDLDTLAAAINYLSKPIST